MSDRQDNSRLAGRLRHQCSRHRRRWRRWGSNPLRCRRLRCCSTGRDTPVPPDSTWSRCRRARLGSTGCCRLPCLSSRRRRCTSHRRNNTCCRTPSRWGSTRRHGMWCHRHNRCCHTPALWNNTPELCNARRPDSSRLRTAGQAGNTRCLCSDLPQGNRWTGKRGHRGSRFDRRSYGHTGSMLQHRPDLPHSSQWPGTPRQVHSTSHGMRLPRCSIRPPGRFRQAGSRCSRTRKQPSRTRVRCRPDRRRSTDQDSRVREDSTYPACRLVLPGSRRRHTGSPPGSTPRQCSGRCHRSRWLRRSIPAGSRHRRGNVFPRHSTSRHMPAHSGSSHPRRMWCRWDSRRPHRRDPRGSSHQPGSGDHTGSSDPDRASHWDSTRRRDR
jgi:hypothetical protein